MSKSYFTKKTIINIKEITINCKNPKYLNYQIFITYYTYI